MVLDNATLTRQGRKFESVKSKKLVKHYTSEEVAKIEADVLQMVKNLSKKPILRTSGVLSLARINI